MKKTGIIVGGGQSRRMGRDKALLKHNGTTLLQHAKNLLSGIGVDEVIVLGRSDDPDGVADSIAHQGPAISLQNWFATQSVPFRAIVLPVDMPFLTVDVMQYLMSFEGGAHFNDQYLPFVATINESGNSQTIRMKHLLSELGVNCAKPPQKWAKLLANINNTTDLTLLSGKN